MSWEQILSEDDSRLFKGKHLSPGRAGNRAFRPSLRSPGHPPGHPCVFRHLFVHGEHRYLAYTDNAFPPSCGLTTTAPSVVAAEIGTGTGYEAAILAEMGVDDLTIEIDKTVGNAANRILSRLGCKVDNTIRDPSRREEAKRAHLHIRGLFPQRGKIELFIGNGAAGLPDPAPFDAIVVAAAVCNEHRGNHSIFVFVPLNEPLSSEGSRRRTKAVCS